MSSDGGGVLRDGGRPVRALMLQGTGSSVGKSLLVAGLCRAFTRRGLAVRPFKPQNMSNNAAVAGDGGEAEGGEAGSGGLGGGEIGRAQALQARACGVAASVHMNPVLLKPQSEVGSQVVVQGRVIGSVRARAYQAMKPGLMPAVLESFARLGAEADLVLVEGAGSASEVNLRVGDIANMGFARATGTPVVVVGDIDRGGVIASLVGTHAVLDPGDAALVVGFIVNRMRGDPGLFDAGMAFVAARTGWAALGLVPHFPGAAMLPAEDAADLPAGSAGLAAKGGALRVAVAVLPMIANFDDLDPLLHEPGVELVLVRPPAPLPVCDVVVLPGSKSTIADLAAFRAAGWDVDLAGHVRRGGRVLGLCGGYQMLGATVCDPGGVEGAAGAVRGLGLLDVDTVLTGEKRLAAVTGRDAAGVGFSGFEMHMGRTEGADTVRPLLWLDGVGLEGGRPDGAVSLDGRVAGTYVHGLFGDDGARAGWLGRMGAGPSSHRHGAAVEAALDGLAAHLEGCMDLDLLWRLAR